MATELLLTTRDTFSWILHIHIKQTIVWYEKELYIPTVFHDSDSEFLYNMYQNEAQTWHITFVQGLLVGQFAVMRRNSWVSFHSPKSMTVEVVPIREERVTS